MNNMFDGAFSGRRVFVTGHTGFKGSWLCSWLLRLGAKVSGFSADIPTNPSQFDLINLGRDLADHRGDIRDLAKLRAALDAEKPHLVFHLAAQPLVRQSYEDPVTTFESNVIGTVNVLEAIRHCPSVEAAVIITSDKAYRNVEWAYGYREDDELGGYDPYSASKSCAELVFRSYVASYFKDGPAMATTRAGNVIGGGDFAQDRIVPDAMRSWAKKEPVVVRMPHATRPWQHVLEPLSGYLLLAARLLGGQKISHGSSYNFGPSSDVVKSVGQLLDAMSNHWHDSKWESLHKDAANAPENECQLLKLCCDKALHELKWRPTLNFDETVKFTVDWYLSHTAHESMRDVTERQIAQYVESAHSQKLSWAV
jgi:CDP-glucose 4,6-dehydratase